MADNSEILKCPACGCEMKKVFISSKELNLDVCVDGCGGIYFDNREFKHFDEQHEDIKEILNALEGKQTDKYVNETLKRTCPYCHATMVKNYSSVKKEVQIDECYSCGGRFLDKNELLKIRAEYATDQERSDDFNKKFFSLIEEEKRKLQ